MPVILSAAAIFGKMLQHGRWWHALLIVVTLTALGITLRWVLQSHALKKRHSQLRTAGQPFTLEELADYYAIPEGLGDSTDLWQEAVQLAEEYEDYEQEEGLPIVGFMDSPDLPAFGEPWPEKDAVALFLEGQAVPLAAIHRAAQIESGVRFPHDFGHDGDVVAELSNLFGPLRRCERLLLLQAYMRARDGDIDGSVQSLREMFAVGRVLEGYPLAVAFWVRTAISENAVYRCASILPFVNSSDDNLKSIQGELRRLDYRQDLHRALAGERAYMLNNCGQGLADTTSVPIPDSAAWYFEPGIQLRILDYLDGMPELSQKPWQDALSYVAKFENHTPSKLSLTDMVVADSLPVLAGTFTRAAQAEARAATLDAAIATELFRRDRQRLPTTLQELVPEYLPAVPSDPFAAGPVQYIIGEDEFLIYSVGEDAIDNQGHVDYEPEVDPRDIGVRWPLQ